MAPATRQPTEATPARMGALAKLPIFLDLAGKRAIVAGGGAPAAWKAELLAAAGANVEVYAAAPGPEMMGLLERGAAAGTLSHRPRPWSVDVLVGAAVALADAADEAEAQAFWCAARAAGVPVNVIDKPDFCQFQFGAIVNRSPVVVGISTDGAAPILGQAIRRRIELLLPPSLAVWGAMARAVRSLVGAELAPGRQRRAFWERFAERAFGPAPEAGDEAAARQLVAVVKNETAPSEGRVSLVGAGPGDSELLTLRAVRVLQSADVILFDDLITPDVLELARREARRIMVGKRGGRDSCAQDDINDLMVALAREGRHVVRLKSGDPTVFGRAGEEIARLAGEGIAVEIVPGITAASAMAAVLRVSLTHRDQAHSVRYVTGHARSGHVPEALDWRGLADPETTLVFYMGGRTASEIAARLMAEGLPDDTPVIVASSVSQPGSKVRRLTLAAMQSPAVMDGLDGPVLIAIGKVLCDARVPDDTSA